MDILRYFGIGKEDKNKELTVCTRVEKELGENTESGPTTSNVVGQQFYVQEPEKEFTARVSNWLQYLGIKDMFPNLNELPTRIIEVGEKLRTAGDASFLGLADEKTNTVLIRPGDYATLLHELTHTNPDFKNKLLSSEAGAFAVQIFAAGDFEGAMGTLTSSLSYARKDKVMGRIIAEASLVLGRTVFDCLKTQDAGISEVQLVDDLGTLVRQYEKELQGKNMSAQDYLVQQHGITPVIADYLLSLTRDSNQTIVRSTSQTKKEVIGAFKALTSFYHVNIGYSLEQAIAQTEKHFQNDEALTIHKTLMAGAKDVFAKLKEYGYDLKICAKISEVMIQQGASCAIAYAKGLPALLEVSGHYGPRGKAIVGFALQHPNFLNALVLTNGAYGLLELSKTEPEQVPFILAELAQYNWNCPLSRESELDLEYVYRLNRRTLSLLTQREKAELTALTFYLTAIDEETAKKISNMRHWSSIGNTFSELGKMALPENGARNDISKLTGHVKEKAAELGYESEPRITTD